MLLTLSLALVQLSQKTSKLTSHDLALDQAKANARLALNIAIAELQKYSGTDQSTTCRADILDTRGSPDHRLDPTIKNPFYTAAFQTSPLDYPNAGKGILLRKTAPLPAFLVSGNEQFNLLEPTLTTYPKHYTTHLTKLDPDHSVTLHKAIGKDASTAIKAPLIRVSQNKGAYAYWVGDEGVKAKINLRDRFRTRNEHLKSDRRGTTEEFLSLLAPSRLGHENAGDQTLGTDHFLYPLIDHPENLAKIVSFHSLDILGDKQKTATGVHRHDFTTTSYSVLTDSLNGGLKKNLTAAANLTDEDFLNLISHTGAEASHPSPVFLYKNHTFPSAHDKLSYLHYPGTPWEVFRSFIRQPEWEPALTGPTPALLSHFSNSTIPHFWELGRRTKSNSVDNLTARLIRRAPILTRFQIGFDYSLGYEGIVTEEDGSKWHEFSMRQHFLPLISYWNPYNANITVSEPQQFAYYTSRDSTTGHLNTHVTAHPATAAPIKVFALADDDTGTDLAWLPPTTAPQPFYYPIHPDGNKASKYDLTNMSCEVPPFVIEPGKSRLFALDGQNKPFAEDRSIQLDPIHSPTSFLGHSAFSKYCKIRVKVTLDNQADDWHSLIPELQIHRFPSKTGAGLTRVHASKSTAFQRTNWDIDKVLATSPIHFTPSVLEDDERLSSSDIDAADSPKFAAALIFKNPDISHYFPAENAHWEASINGLDTNPYLAPWGIFYNPLASRHGAYGAAPSAPKAFAAPPLYIAGTIIGNDAYSLIHPELTPSAEPFTGYNDTAGGGSAVSIQYSLPRYETPILSIGHFHHINTSKWISNYNSLNKEMASSTDAVQAACPVGNSFAPPHIPLHHTSLHIYDETATGTGSIQGIPYATQYDTSFRYNHVLWDRYFLSGHRPNQMTSASQLTSVSDIASKLPNQSLTPISGIDLATLNNPHTAATKLMLNGGFNINSTSVEAWKTILASTAGLRTSSLDPGHRDLTPFPRLNYVNATPITTPPLDPTQPSHYDGSRFRALTEEEITQLAQEIVKQVKLRGPAATLSQFINRALHPSHLHHGSQSADLVCYEGPIQSAINASDINGAFNKNNAQFPPDLAVSDETNVSDFEKGLINPKSLKYHSGYGCPTTLTQADILARIGHRITARSDTFTIRAYGESRNHAGKVIARACCEAIVQRSPAFSNPADPADTPPFTFQNHQWLPNPALSPSSQQFGRRYSIISFRWLPIIEVSGF